MSWRTRLARLFRPESMPPVEPAGDPQRIAETQAVLTEMRPYLIADGGDVDLLEVTDEGTVRVRFRGACRSCGARTLTLHGALAPRLRERLPWFTCLVDDD